MADERPIKVRLAERARMRIELGEHYPGCHISSTNDYSCGLEAILFSPDHVLPFRVTWTPDSFAREGTPIYAS